MEEKVFAKCNPPPGWKCKSKKKTEIVIYKHVVSRNTPLEVYQNELTLFAYGNDNDVIRGKSFL